MADDTKQYLSARKKLKSAKTNSERKAAAEAMVGGKLAKLGL